MAVETGPYILDTSYFLLDLPLSGILYTVSRVTEELLDLRSKARLSALLENGLIIMDPSSGALKIVNTAAEETGDRSVLSETDRDLLALASELRGVIVTDDFAIQNTAGYMNIPVRPILQKKADHRRWKIRCSGCGRYLKTMPPEKDGCPVCGSPVKRKVK